MADTPKGRATRQRILDAAWRLSDERGPELVLGGVTLREIAAAVGMAPSAVTYHFPTMTDLALGMVRQLTQGISPLRVAAVEDRLGQVDDQGPAGAVRLAAELNWQVLTSPGEVDFERRLVRCYGAAACDDEVQALLSGLVATWVGDLMRIYEHALGQLDLHLIEPFQLDDLARAVAAMAEGLLHHWMCDEASVRPDLLADVVVALVSAAFVPVERHVHLDELGAPLSSADRPTLAHAEYLDLAGGAASLFVDGIEDVTLTDAARHLGLDAVAVTARFGSVARLAATSFGRHVGPVTEAVARRRAVGPAVSLTDGVYELSRCVLADRHCALALAHERHRQRVAATSPPADMAATSPPADIHELVPVGSVLAEPLARVMDRPTSEVVDLADLVVDTVLTQAATRPRTPPATITETALRLVPATN